MPSKSQILPGGGIGLLLVSGSASSLVGKILYAVKGPDRHGRSKAFAKPWFAALLMFIGMLACLPCSWIYRAARSQLRGSDTSRTKPEDTDTEERDPLIGPSESTWSLESVAVATRAWWHRYDAVLFPTIFDLVASALLGIGLLFTTVSVYQMVRGTEILFTAALSSIVLHRRLNSQNLWGLAFCLTGILLVGASSMLSADKSSFILEDSNYLQKGYSVGETLLGMSLIVIAEAVQASQVVAEDWLMSVAETKLPAIEVVGYEGLFGTVLMSAIVLPVLQVSRLGPEGGGLQEDSLESLHMLRGSPRLALTAASYIGLMAVYNLSGMMVTDSMGALSRTVAETARTLLVWGLDLMLYYNVHIKGTTSIGEPWTSHSWLQAVGFAVLVFGTSLYAAGEERHAKELKEKLHQRAQEEWARLRSSVPRLLDLARERVGPTEEERRTPVRAARIAGPARIRVALSLLQAREWGRRTRRRMGQRGALNPPPSHGEGDLP